MYSLYIIADILTIVIKNSFRIIMMTIDDNEFDWKKYLFNLSGLAQSNKYAIFWQHPAEILKVAIECMIERGCQKKPLYISAYVHIHA